MPAAPGTTQERVPAAYRGDSNGLMPNMGSGDSVPATPLDKYYTMRDSYLRDGKEWKWQAMRDLILQDYVIRGWPAQNWTMSALAEIQDVDHDENPERARLIRMDDRAAKAELDALKKQTEAAAARAMGTAAVTVSEVETLRHTVGDLVEQNKQLMAQLSRGAVVMSPEMPEGNTVAPAPRQPVVAVDPTVEPSIRWSKEALFDYAAANNIVLSEALSLAGTSKADIVEGLRAEMDARAAKAEAAAEPKKKDEPLAKDLEAFGKKD